MRHWVVRLLFAGLALGPVAAGAEALQSDLIPLDRVMRPAQPAQGVVFLLSDASGWGAREENVARRLVESRLAVVGVDMPAYLRAIAADKARALRDQPGDTPCVYLVSDMESLSQQIQRESGSGDYMAPIVAGIGQGGGLALAVMDQTPDVTIGATVAVDPAEAVPLAQELCTPARFTLRPDGYVYDLPRGRLEDPATVLLSKTAPEPVRARAVAFRAGAMAGAVELREVAAIGTDDIVAAVRARADALRAARDRLPIAVLPAKARYDSMAIILSGDGGWRDIDQSVGRLLQKAGVPVIGLDTLRYFWTRRSPEETARALASLIARYRAAWGVDGVALIGYSFGADVLPASFNRLPEAIRAHVRLISLMGLSRRADWEITVSGWLGSHGARATPVAPELARIPGALVQCVYGAAEENSACPDAGGLGMEAVRMPGGHHFGGDYAKVATLIEQSLSSRLAARAAARPLPSRAAQATTRPGRPGP